MDINGSDAVIVEEAVYREAVSVKISVIEAQMRRYDEQMQQHALEIRELRRRLDEFDKENGL